MTTGHPSKAALGAARIALLAGVSAAALSLASQANAQVVLDGTAANTNLCVNGAGQVGTRAGGSCTVLPGAATTATGVTVGTGVANQTHITSGAFTTGDGVTATVGGTLDVMGATTTNGISNTGNVGTDTLSTTGNATIGGTLGVTGVTTTNGISNTGNVGTDTLTVTGLSTFGSGANTTIDAGGNLTVTNGFTNTASVTTDVGGLNSTYAGLVATTGYDGRSTTVSAPGYVGTNDVGATTVVIDNQTGSAGFTGNVTVGSNLGVAGNAAVGGELNVTGQSNLSGGATIKNNLTVSGPADVSMGNNVVHDVATPIVGTDATNKAYVDKGLNKAYEGTAIALAISQPVFLPGQTFAIRGGWGDYEGQNAFGVSAAGVIAHNVLGYGSTVSLDAGIGAGNSSVAGKAGVTVGFGGGSAPLK